MMPNFPAILDGRSGVFFREDRDAAMPTPSQPLTARSGARIRLVRGQLVEVRSAREIAATLDADGKLDGLPFMPEMAALCGRRFRVDRRADMTCVEGYGLRRLQETVFLEDVRCDGAAHDGCGRRCLMFWKEAWLKPIEAADAASMVPQSAEPARFELLKNLPTRRDDRYLCQSTELAAATTDLPGWNILPYVSQIRDGELSVKRFVQIFALAVLNLIRKSLGYKDVGQITGEKSRSSKNDLKLQFGEWVRIKSLEEIRQTLDPAGRNRGLVFEAEMTEYSGKLFQMDVPVKRMIHEETGKMIPLTNTVALQRLTCHGLCAKNCPRNNYWFWREDWLERVPSSHARKDVAP